MSRLLVSAFKKDMNDTMEIFDVNPWAGLSSYEDPIKSGKGLKFCGRKDESYDVTQLIVNNIFVTLYGKSGVGKTSLLNAGIFPQLRRKHFLPINVRLSMDAVDMSFQDCIIKKISDVILNDGSQQVIDVVPEMLDKCEQEYLWTYFARTRFTDKDGHVLFPVIVLDQFEEVLRTRREETEILLRQIHYLMDESHALSNRMVGDYSYRYDFNFRFVVSIREDDFYRLEDSIDHNYLLEMKRCRFRLCSLTEQGASDVILLPGSGLIDENKKQEIVGAIINIARNIDDNSINTNLLSLVCFRIYEEYKKNKGNQITIELVRKFVSRNPFENFYNEITSTLSEKEKSYIEEHLVDCMGRRDSVPESVFFTHVKKGEFLLKGATKILQRTSVSSNPNNCRIELIHDSFCEPLVIQKEKRTQRKRILQMLMVVVGLLLVVIGALWIIGFMNVRHNKMLENQSRYVAEKALRLVENGDSYLARILALEVLPKNLNNQDRPYTTEAEWALRNANVDGTAILRGHTGFVTSLACNQDATSIITSSYDKTISLWDALTGKELRKLYGHNDIINSVDFDALGKYIVSASKDYSIMLWNVNTGEVVDTLWEHTGGVNSATFSLDGKYIISASDDKTIKIWNVEKGIVVKTLSGHQANVNSAILTKDNKYAVSASDDKTIRIWNVEKGELIDSLLEHNDKVNNVCLSRDNKYLVSSSSDRTIKIWDFHKRKILRTLNASNVVESAAFSPDNNYIVSSSWDNKIIIWDTSTGCLVDSLMGHSDMVTKSLFSPDGRKIFSASWDNTARIWDFPSVSHSVWVKNPHGSIESFSLSGMNGDSMVTSTGNQILIWNARNGSVIDSLKGHSNVIRKVSFSPDGKKIASASWDKTIRIWDTERGQILETLSNHDDYVEDVSFSPDGKKIVSASWDNTLRVWNAENGEELKVLDKHKDIVLSVVFSADSRMIASCSKDSTIILWDANNYTQLKNFRDDMGPIVTLGLSPDMKYLASASTGHTIKIWDVDTETEYKLLEGHLEEVTSISFSPNGKYLVSSSKDNTIKVWDVFRGELLQSIEKHTDDVNVVSFTADGLFIVSGSKDKTLRKWSFPETQDLIDTTMNRFKNRELSIEEQKRFYINLE